MIKVAIIAPIRVGGTHNTMKTLATNINKEKNIQTKFYNSLYGYLVGIFSYKFDIIHTALPVPFNIFGKKVILHIHGNFKKERGIRNPLGYFYPIAIKNANKIIVPSNFLRKKLKLKNALVINNPIKNGTHIKKKYSPIKKNTIKLIIATKFYFYEKGKGLIDLVEVLNKLKCKIELDVYGKGPYLNEIKNKCEKINKTVKISYKGFTKNLNNKSTNYDIFTYYSHLDTFGIVLSEMQRNGLPVITNEFGAALEVINNSKDGFISKDKNDYKTKLEKLIKSTELRKKYGKAGIKNSKRFSIKNITKQIIEVYEK